MERRVAGGCIQGKRNSSVVESSDAARGIPFRSKTLYKHSDFQLQPLLCWWCLKHEILPAISPLPEDKDIPSLSLSPSLIDLLTRERLWSLWLVLAQYLGIPPILKFIFTIVIRQSQSRRTICNPFFSQFPPNPKPSVSPKSSMIFKIFNEIETSNIVKACRLNGWCTVTGALMTANHMAFCKLLQDGGYSCKDVQLEHSFAINTQRDC